METAPPRAKKGSDIRVLRCLNDECRNMLPFEVTGPNILYLDLAWMGRTDGLLRYLPCPGCGGRNVVEPHVDEKGRHRHRVTRFEPAPAAG